MERPPAFCFLSFVGFRAAFVGVLKSVIKGEISMRNVVSGRFDLQREIQRDVHDFSGMREAKISETRVVDV